MAHCGVCFLEVLPGLERKVMLARFWLAEAGCAQPLKFLPSTVSCVCPSASVPEEEGSSLCII